MAKTKSIKSRITLINISLVVIIGVLGLFSFYSLHNISQAISSLITTNYNSIERIAQMETCLKEQRQDALLLVYDNDPDRYYQAFTELEESFLSVQEAEYDTIVLSEEMEMIVNIRTDFEAFCSKFYNLYVMKKSGASLSSLTEYYEKTMTPQYQQVLIALDELRTSNETALFGRRDEAAAIVEKATVLLSFLFFLAAGISFFLFRSYMNKLFGPIYEITQNLKSIRQGNMNRKAVVRNTDELGILCNEFNNMTQRLSEFEQSTMGSLMEEKNKTYSIVRSISEPLLILDADYHVTLVNQSFEALFHTTMDAAIGQHFLDVIATNGFAGPFSEIHYKTNVYWEKAMKVDHANHGVQYFNVMVSPIFTPEEKKNFVIIVFYDITEMKLLEKMRTDFIATISHEFKTPLTSILMGADLLSNDFVGPINDEQREIIDTLKEDGQQLNELVNDLLELSKVESSSVIYQFSTVSVSACVQKCLHQFRPRAKKVGVVLEERLQPDLPLVWADMAKIIWVLNNLVSNALKYTANGDRILLSAEATDQQQVLVCVEDNGTGIPPEFLNKIFDKYVQVPGCDLEARGTGLGLAVAKDILTAHQGRIWCESDLAVGSRFYFTLPVAPNGEETTPTANDSPKGATS